MDQNPHCVPDPGSAGRHHDLGSFGGNYRERKARSERCVCVRGEETKQRKEVLAEQKRKFPSGSFIHACIHSYTFMPAFIHTRFPSPRWDLGI